jgi:hypothetical protein
MASHPTSSKLDGEAELGSRTGVRRLSPDSKHPEYLTDQTADSGDDILSGQGLDPVLTAKLRLFNDVSLAQSKLDPMSLVPFCLQRFAIGHRRNWLDAVPLATLLLGWLWLRSRLHGDSHQECHPAGHHQRVQPQLQQGSPCGEQHWSDSGCIVLGPLCRHDRSQMGVQPVPDPLLDFWTGCWSGVRFRPPGWTFYEEPDLSTIPDTDQTTFLSAPLLLCLPSVLAETWCSMLPSSSSICPRTSSMSLRFSPHGGALARRSRVSWPGHFVSMIMKRSWQGANFGQCQGTPAGQLIHVCGPPTWAGATSIGPVARLSSS